MIEQTTEKEREREIVRHFASFASTDCQHQHQRQIPSVKLAERGGAIADALTREINRRATRTRFAVQAKGRESTRLLLLMCSLIDKNNLDHLLNEQSAIMNSGAEMAINN